MELNLILLINIKVAVLWMSAGSVKVGNRNTLISLMNRSYSQKLIPLMDQFSATYISNIKTSDLSE